MNIKVSPKLRRPDLTHDIALSRDGEKIGLKFDGDAPSVLQHQPYTDPARRFTESIKDWTGGRGRRRLREDPTAYWDAKDAWGLVAGKMFPAPDWYYGTGIRVAERSYRDGNSVGWRKLYAGSGDVKRYSAVSFVASASSNRRKVQIPVRQVGIPGTLTFAVYSNSGGSPGTVLTGATATKAATAGDFEVQDLMLNLGTLASLTAATTYWILVYGASTDNETNHWEIGVNEGGTGSKISANGTDWSVPTDAFAMYYNIVAVDAGQMLYFWEMDTCLYAINALDSNDAPTIYINGDRGTATSATSTTLVDTRSGVTSGWTNGQWIDWWIKIVAGRGKGQIRQITDNDSTSVTVAAWDVNPNTTSRYVIYGGLKWTALTGTHGLTVAPTCKPIAVNHVTYVTQGDAVNIRRFREATSAADNHEYADTGTAYRYDFLAVHTMSQLGVQVWAAKSSNNSVAYTIAPAWGGTATFKPIKGLYIGSPDYGITSLYSGGKKLYAGTADGLWWINENTARRLSPPIKESPHPNNMKAITASGDAVYYGYGGSFGYMVGTKHIDLLNFRDGYEGLPADRAGDVSQALTVGGWTLFSVDGGASNYSAVYAWNGRGIHEIWRGWAVGVRIRDMYYYACPGTNGQLWIDASGEPVCVKLPYNKTDPLLDTTMRYRPELSFVTGVMDVDNENLKKMFAEIALASENLGASRWVEVDYQKNENVNTSNWERLGTISRSPYKSIAVKLGNVGRIAFRFRALTTDSSTPPVLRHISIPGEIAQESKFMWVGTFRVSDRDMAGGMRDHSPTYKWLWLRKMADNEEILHMEAAREIDHDKDVTISVPVDVANRIDAGDWDGRISIQIREV